MDRMEKFLNSSLLDSLCDLREDEFETLYILSNKGKDVKEYEVDPEQDLLNVISEIVCDKEKISLIRKKLNKLEEEMFGDLTVSLRRIYKLGFLDGYSMKKEIQDLSKEDFDGKNFRKLYE